MNKTQQIPRSFMQDTSTEYRYLIERNGRPVPIGQININSISIVNPRDDNTYDGVIVNFTTYNNTYTTSIPYNDYIHMNFLPYFKEFIKHPDCKAEFANELLFYLIRTAKKQEFIYIPIKSTWFLTNKDIQILITKSSYNPYIYKFLPPSIFNREITYTQKSLNEVLESCSIFFKMHWKLKILICFRIASIFLSLIKQLKIGLTDKSRKRLVKPHELWYN